MNILVGYDNSDESKIAVEVAKEHAKAFNAKVLVLHSRVTSLPEDETEQVRKELEDIKNDFKEMGELIMDRATGRMWQKAGAEGYVTYEEAKAYIDELNQQKFAGYDDWRLPTIPELASLVEKDKQENGMYLSPLFDTTQFWCWSADVTIPKIAWLVDFKHGTVNAALRSYYNYVRAVRF